MRLYLDDRTGIFDDGPTAAECAWETADGTDCGQPADGLFCAAHEEGGENDPGEYLRQKAAAEYRLD